MSSQRFNHERSFYNFMKVIGDIGGFNGAIVMFPAFFLSFFSPKMFEGSLLMDVPVKRRGPKRKNPNSLDKRLARGQDVGTLDQGDVESILEELSLTTKIKIKLYRTLCYFKSFVGKSKQAKLRKKVVE